MRHIEKSLITRVSKAPLVLKLKAMWRHPFNSEKRKAFRKNIKRDRKINNIKNAEKNIINDYENPDNIKRINFSSVDEKFVSYNPPNSINPLVKIVAFYLPQFHPIPENDQWWGKGFTEWYNVGKALPNFINHYQPHCPIHFGYYDLRVKSVMEEQAIVARQYGVSAFSFYFYWFSGKTLLEKPLMDLIENPSIDIEFCLTWANENWTRRWDGQDQEVLIARRYSEEDPSAFIKYINKYFKDKRYIKIDNRPVLIVYRADIIPNIKKIIEIWRSEAVNQGFSGLYLVAALTFGMTDPTKYGFDAAVEFPPHQIEASNITNKFEIINNKFEGDIYDYAEASNNAIKKEEPVFKLFRSATLSWDNTARRQDNAHIMGNFSLTRYFQWISALCFRVAENPKYENNEKLVFVNAWNEWAEGTHLEPDRKHGFGYLKATYDAVAPHTDEFIAPSALPSIRNGEFALILHMHYAEIWQEIREAIRPIQSCDIYITTTDPQLARVMKADLPNSWIQIVENRGRDIRPFLSMLKKIRSLKYTAVCKLHSKRTLYKLDGDAWRKNLFANIADLSMAKKFLDQPKLGLIAPKGHYVEFSAENMLYNLNNVVQLCGEIKIEYRDSAFPAGSMYWFRPEALESLDLIDLHKHWDMEKGLADGTTAHAVERIISLAVEQAGYAIELV